MSTATAYRLAPMSRPIAVLTAVLLLVPVLLLVTGLELVASIVAALYVWAWAWM